MMPQDRKIVNKIVEKLEVLWGTNMLSHMLSLTNYLLIPRVIYQILKCH